MGRKFSWSLKCPTPSLIQFWCLTVLARPRQATCPHRTSYTWRLPAIMFSQWLQRFSRSMIISEAQCFKRPQLPSIAQLQKQWALQIATGRMQTPLPVQASQVHIDHCTQRDWGEVQSMPTESVGPQHLCKSQAWCCTSGILAPRRQRQDPWSSTSSRPIWFNELLFRCCFENKAKAH